MLQMYFHYLLTYVYTHIVLVTILCIIRLMLIIEKVEVFFDGTERQIPTILSWFCFVQRALSLFLASPALSVFLSISFNFLWLWETDFGGNCGSKLRLFRRNYGDFSEMTHTLLEHFKSNYSELSVILFFGEIAFFIFHKGQTQMHNFEWNNDQTNNMCAVTLIASFVLLHCLFFQISLHLRHVTYFLS